MVGGHANRSTTLVRPSPLVADAGRVGRHKTLASVLEGAATREGSWLAMHFPWRDAAAPAPAGGSGVLSVEPERD